MAEFLKLKEGGSSSEELQGRLRHIEGVTLSHAHKFIVRRWKNLQEVRRLTGAWLLVIAMLTLAGFWQSSQFERLYSAEVPAENTTYTEGVYGALDNINPLFAGTPAERAASRLIFASLFTYDEQNRLVGELVQKYTVDETAKVYTMTLRPDAHWHDGLPVTAADVAYTFGAIKNADTRSGLYSSWRNITVEQVDERTVRFTLPGPYTPFLNALVVGILPEHALKNVRPSELRNHPFSRSPTIGSGPFVFQDIHSVNAKQGQSVLRLAANKDYFLGAPKLNRFQLHSYAERDALVNAFRTQEVAAISDASSTQLESLADIGSAVRTDSPLYNAVYAFLKMDNPVLQDLRVRQALALSIDQPAVIKKLNNRVQPVSGPLLSGQQGYQGDLKQAPTNLHLAKQLLEEAGWRPGAEGKRFKDGQPLKLQLVTVSSGDYPAIVEELMSQWSKVGISFEPQLVKQDDIQQNTIVPRAYDILVYELALGKDPDVYAYWHSSQATERGFNLSEYASPNVDDALDSARSRSDQALRDAKYRTFVQRWLADVPAIGLYRPALTYMQTKGITSFKQRNLVEPIDRYYNVRYWSATKEQLRPTL